MQKQSNLDITAIGVNSNVSARNYWRNRFDKFEFHECFECFTDNHILKHNDKESEYSVIASDKTLKSLKEIVNTDKATHIVLLSVLGILAQKCSYYSDVVVLNPRYSGAKLSKDDNYLIPFRMCEISDMSFMQYLSKVKDKYLEDYKYCNYPYNRILDMEDDILNEQGILGIFIKKTHHQNVFKVIHPSILFCFEVKENLLLTIKYNTKKYNRHNIQNIADVYLYFLQKLIESPGKKIKNIELISEEQRNLLIYELNNTKVDYLKDKTVIDLFVGQVGKTPNSTAVVFGDKKIDYISLNRKSDELANILSSKKRSSKIVGLYMEPSIEMIIGILAVIKSGSAFLPLDPNHNSKRQVSILKESKCEILITQQVLVKELSFNGDIIVLDNDTIKYSCADFNCEKVQSSDLLYVIYTSGSTGKPKGVLIKHSNMVNYILWLKNTLQLTIKDKSILTSSYAFDLGYSSIFPILCSGGELHLIENLLYRSAEGLLDCIEQNKISYLKITPSLLSIMTMASNFSKKNLNSLRFIMLGGEQIIVQDIKKAADVFEHIEFINHYGPTETTIGVIAKKIDNFQEFNYRQNIGRPIYNTTCYILGNNLELLPKGCKGELYIGGENVGLGYIGQKELNKNRFIKNPYKEGELIYRTGDLVRWLPEGDVEFLGRIDNQIKIRGYRIELSEIEHQMNQIDEINFVVVKAKYINDEQFVVAYFTAESEIDIEHIRTVLNENLPEYMIPSFFMQLDSLPLNPNGKIDHKALPDVEFGTKKNYLGPSNRTEQELVKIWGEILKIDKNILSIKDSFFFLGGNSLKATFLINRINQSFNINIPLKLVFELPTIQEFSKYIEAFIVANNASEDNNQLDEESLTF